MVVECFVLSTELITNFATTKRFDRVSRFRAVYFVVQFTSRVRDFPNVNFLRTTIFHNLYFALET